MNHSDVPVVLLCSALQVQLSRTVSVRCASVELRLQTLRAADGCRMGATRAR
jgi:hypothetical protein